MKDILSLILAASLIFPPLLFAVDPPAEEHIKKTCLRVVSEALGLVLNDNLHQILSKDEEELLPLVEAYQINASVFQHGIYAPTLGTQRVTSIRILGAELGNIKYAKLSEETKIKIESVVNIFNKTLRERAPLNCKIILPGKTFDKIKLKRLKK